ncbi:MAG: protein kinase [Rubritalea sp.]|uniref:serine/threonine protein kinase n=1 Tax=Rubritalea sp. TaxID=2109375 RepID=UPI0032425E0C
MDEERYEINSLMGKGRTGGVYAAEDTQLKRTVAVRRFYSAGGDTSSAGWEKEFVAIAQNLGNLQNPNLLTVLDAGVDEDGAFLVARLLEGKRLSEFITKTHLDQYEAHEMASQLLDALALSHEAGFIHGALTAGSIMLVERARGGHRYIIMDMGLSRLAPLIQGADSSYAMMADPALLAPELFEGEPATEVSDCYMLGHLIYLSLIGGHPFAHKPIDEVKVLHQSGALPPLATYLKDISPAFVNWISTLTNPDIAKRPQSAAAALKTLPKLSPKKPAAPAGAITKKPPTAAPILLKRTAQPARQAQPVKAQAKAPVAVTKSSIASPPVAASPVRKPSTSPPPAAQSPAPNVATTNVGKIPAIDEAPKTKNKKKLILAVTLPLLIITGVILAAILPKDDSDSLYEEIPDGKPLNAALESSNERANIPTFYSNDVADGHSRDGCDLPNKEKNDWWVFRSPLDDSHEKSNGRIIIKKRIFPIGTSSFEPKNVSNLIFTKPNKKKLSPNFFVKTPTNGDGCKIRLKTKFCPPSITLKFHFTTWGCDAKIRITSEDGKTDLAKEYVYRDDKKNVSFATSYKLTEEQLKDHEIFLIELTALNVETKDSSGLSLNALIVE